MPLRVLYETQSHNERLRNPVDIVAVHGLNEGGETCWKDQQSGKIWLIDILPPDIPVRRILSYEYATNPSILLGDDAANNILQTAHTLVADLEAVRNLSDTVERPLIFVGHDLGGILVKKALAYSATQVSKKVEHRYSIYISTYAIMFFGTPHSGYTADAWQYMAKSLPRSLGLRPDLSPIIARFNETLQNITDEFAPLLKQFNIYFFWESKPSHLGSSKGYFVSQDSAAPMWDKTERCGIEATHPQMSKFDSESSPGFTIIKAALRRYGHDCHPTIARRWQIARKFLETQRSIEATELVGFDIHDANKPYVYPNSPKYEKPAKLENKYYFVPHNVSAIYTGWDSVTKELQHSLLTPRSPLSRRGRKIYVLFGLGGSGKTQFCLKFVHDYRQRFWAVFWLDASRTENAERELSRIGKLGGLGDNHQAGIYWLTGLSVPWLLVLDNADDPDTDYAKYFPDGETGHIIVTSRLKACKAHATVGSHEFRQMSEKDSTTLLLRAAGVNGQASKKDRHSAQKIARKLGYLPLALTQAGASIRQSICTFQEYVDLYDSHKAEMLDDHLVQGTDQYEHTVYTTWEVSVQRIQKAKTMVAADAMDILHTMAFLHFEQIPMELFSKAWTNGGKALNDRRNLRLHPENAVIDPKDTIRLFFEMIKIAVGYGFEDSPYHLPNILTAERTAWDTMRFRRALSVLEGHCLIYKDVGKQSYSMHPMVHLWSRERLSSEEQRVWSNYAINTLATSLTPTANKTNREYRRSLTPHIDACLLQQHQSAAFIKYQDKQTLASAMKFSTVYAENGEWCKAEGLQRQVIRAREQHLGLAHADTLDAMADLADGCWNMFNVGEALLLYNKIAKNSAKAYGARDRRALKVMDNMAKTLWLAGQTNEALRWSEKATMAMHDCLGEGHPDTLTAVFNLSRNLMHRGYPEQAAEKLEFVLAQRRRMLGDSHPDTLSAFAELGIACRHLRQLDKAEQLLHLVVQERSRIIGAQHAYTLWAINDLAKIYTDQGRPRQAERLLVDILDIVAITLGPEHIGMLMTKHNLARAYNGQGKWVQGQSTLLKLMAIQKRKLPPRHPDVFSARLELLRTRRHLGELREAERSLKVLIGEMEVEMGKEHPLTRRAVGQLSAIYIDMGRLDEAEGLDKRLRKGGEGSENTEVVDSTDEVSDEKRSTGDGDMNVNMQRRLRDRHASTW